MLQAEVGGGARIDPEHGLQKAGYMLRDFILNSADGERVQISSYRGRANLVLVFAAEDAQQREFLRDLASHQQELTEQETVVIVVLPMQPELQQTRPKPFVRLIDEDSSVHRLYGAVDQEGKLATVIYVTDRFGEIVSVFHTFGGEPLPKPEEVLKLLEFLNQQCPECEPPEWPR